MKRADFYARMYAPLCEDELAKLNTEVKKCLTGSCLLMCKRIVNIENNP